MSHLAPASIPSPSSGVLEIGPLSIHAYGLMIAIGVVAGVWLTGRRLEARGAGTRDDASSMAVWAVFAGVIGARLYHVATEWSSFSGDLFRIVQIWRGGLGIPGGLLAGIVVGLWATRRRGVDPAVMATCAAPGVALAQSIGRWGNWFNQELFGGPTTLPWALRVSDSNALQAGYPPGTTFHPTFLYESLWNLALVFVLLWIDRRFRLRPPRLLAVYLMGYGLGRFWVEGLRIDPAHELGGLRWNQWVAAAVVIGAGIYLLLTRKGGRDPEPVPAESGDASPDAEVWVGDSAEDPVDEWSAIDAELELSSPSSDGTRDDTADDVSD
ncbi:MAG: prolipoprotein diacylglyceryl transferase [Actinomycetota bacterium]|jgi:prolipoprotein diacylglyceryl transferase